MPQTLCVNDGGGKAPRQSELSVRERGRKTGRKERARESRERGRKTGRKERARERGRRRRRIRKEMMKELEEDCR